MIIIQNNNNIEFAILVRLTLAVWLYIKYSFRTLKTTTIINDNPLIYKPHPNSVKTTVSKDNMPIRNSILLIPYPMETTIDLIQTANDIHKIVLQLCFKLCR